MLQRSFYILFNKLEAQLKRKYTHWRKTITPKERLAALNASEGFLIFIAALVKINKELLFTETVQSNSLVRLIQRLKAPP